MATYVQRWTALGEALLGKPATTEQLTRLGLAISQSVPPTPGATPYADMTNAQKAEFAIKHVRQYLVGMVKAMDQRTAAATAAAQASAVDAEFAEAP